VKLDGNRGQHLALIFQRVNISLARHDGHWERALPLRHHLRCVLVVNLNPHFGMGMGLSGIPRKRRLALTFPGYEGDIVWRRNDTRTAIASGGGAGAAAAGARPV